MGYSIVFWTNSQRDEHHFPREWVPVDEGDWFTVNRLPVWVMSKLQNADRAIVRNAVGVEIQVLKDRYGGVFIPPKTPKEIQLIVTMDMIDAERSLANEYLQIKRELDRVHSQESQGRPGYHHREAYVRTHPHSNVTTLVSYDTLLKYMETTKAEIQRLLSRWWAQGCKAQLPPSEYKLKIEPYCDCGSVGTHLKGSGPCYNTGDALGDLDKIMSIPYLDAQRACYGKWKRNYVKVVQASNEIDTVSLASVKNPEGLKAAHAKMMLKDLGFKASEAAEIRVENDLLKGKSMGSYSYYNTPNYRVSAKMIVLSNKELK